MSAHTLGHLKHEVIKAYNAVNQDMFVAGVSQQRAEIWGDKILIVAEHRRIPALAVLDAAEPIIAHLTDMVLIGESKRRLGRTLESVVGQKVVAVLKDYDPESTLAATVVVFDKPLDLA